jgi:hypothetical protein
MKIAVRILILVIITLITSARAQDTSYTAFSRLDYYTNEENGEVAVFVPDSKKGMKITIDVVFEFEFLVQQHLAFPGHTVPIQFPLAGLPIGDNELTLSFYENDKWIDSRKVNVVVGEDVNNEVKVDRLTGTLICDGIPFVPVGFYCTWPVEMTLPEQEAVRGFNLLSPYWRIDKRGRKDRLRFMDRCAELGMKVNYNLCSVAGGGGNSTSRSIGLNSEEKLKLLREEIELMRDHPALLAWYISDEPVGQGVPADSLQAAYDLIKVLDPYHPVSIVFMAPHKAEPYREVMDVAMTDPYPIPHASILEVEKHVNSLMGFYQHEKAVWIVPQAFGGNEWWTREPTAKEVKAMTYLGLVNGASGIQYFIRKGPHGTPKSQATWGECGAVAQEVMALTPALCSGLPAPKIFTSHPEIRAKAFNQFGLFTILVVNVSPEPLEIVLRMDEIDLTMEGEVMFESRKISMEEGVIRDIIDGYGVRTYRFDNRQKLAWIKDFHPQNMAVDGGFENNALPAIPASCYASPGKDPGATYFIDGRVTKEGDQAIRLVTPRKGQGVTLSFYGLELDPDRSYTCSVWARAGESNLPQRRPGRFALRKMENSFVLGLGKRAMEKGRRGKKIKRTGGVGENGINPSRERFYLSETWEKYSFTTAGRTLIPSLSNRYSPWLRFDGRGMAWFDVLQVVPDMEIRNRKGEKGKGRVIELISNYDNHEIFYTTDGNVPSHVTSPYLGPLRLGYSALVRAASYKDGKLTGTIQQDFHIHKASTAMISYDQPYEKYEASGKDALIDGIKGSLYFKDGKWQGFHGNNAEIIINLGEKKEVSSVSMTFLQDISVWIFLPQQVLISISSDGLNYEKIVLLAAKKPLNRYGAFIEEFRTEFDNAQVQFIRVEARNIGTCPEWHSGTGEPAWIFLDEVVVE